MRPPTSTPSGLATQQRQLRQAIAASGDAPAGLLRAVPDREPLLRIYQHAYTARLAAALRENFPSLPIVMGDEAFDELAAAYITTHPSRHPSIRWFGDRLADFMSAHEVLVPHPALVDLARMEWALRGAFDAADAVPLTAAALAPVAPAEWAALVFRPVPSLQLVAMQWAVEPLWRALQTEAGEQPEPQAQRHTLLVWRQGLDNRWRSVDAMQATLLRAMVDGRSFGELCALAATQAGEHDAAEFAAGVLQRWLADELLAAP